MNLRLFHICVLLLFLTISSIAQAKPDWFSSIENSIKQKESSWEISEEKQGRGDSCFVYSLILKSGNKDSAISIVKFDNSVTAKEKSTALINFHKKVFNEHTTEIKLENIGDEGYLWETKDNEWTAIIFKKGDFFIKINSPSKILGEKFTQYVLEQLPKT